MIRSKSFSILFLSAFVLSFTYTLVEDEVSMFITPVFVSKRICPATFVEGIAAESPFLKIICSFAKIVHLALLSIS